EVECFGGSLHPLAPGVENVTVAAAEEVARLVHQRQIVGLRDALDAGRRAALDLVLQAGAGAAGKLAVAAAAQRKGPRQRVQRDMDGTRRGEGAEILARDIPRAAMLGDAGI